MIKPNLISSHDWHVQPNCQRSLRAFRLSGALLDRGPAFRPACPRTRCASPFSHRNASIGVFARTFQTYRTSPRLSSQPLLRPRPLQRTVGGCSSMANPISPTGTHPFKSLAPRTISKSNQRSAPEPIRLTGVFSWVLQWLVLCGIPYRGFRGICLT